MTHVAATFFDERREWSRRKHEVFTGYVPQFARILGRSRGTVNLVDGFAGAGYYGVGDDREPGSPILAAGIAQKLATEGSYGLRCINVEAQASAFTELQENTKPYVAFVDNRRGKFATHIDGILTDIGHDPTLFFLDPFGVGGLDWTTLSKIARRAAVWKTEFLINFNVRNFDRNAGWLDSFAQKPREAFLHLLDRTVGTDEWQAIYAEDIPQAERYRRLASYYQHRITRTFGLNVASYPVRGVEKGDVKYYLIFGTKHPLGLRIMSSILYGVERRYVEEQAQQPTRQTVQLSLGLFPDPPTIDDLERDKVAQLTQDVLALVGEVRALTFVAVQDRLMARWFGRVSERHYRQACQSLVASGHLTGPTRGIGDRTIFQAADVSSPRGIDHLARTNRWSSGRAHGPRS